MIRNRIRLIRFGFALSFLTISQNSVFANVGETFGFSAKIQGRAGIGVTSTFDGFSSYHNPAGLSLLSAGEDTKRLKLEWSLIYMRPNFKPIDNVVVTNQYTSDRLTYDRVDTSYRSTFGQAIGLGYRLFPENFNFTVGLTVFLPVEQAAYMDTGETFVPEYVLYRARTHRPQIEAGFGADLGSGFHLGVGIHLGFGLTTNASVFLQSDAARPSTMRFTSSLKPKAAPYFGLLFSPRNDPDLFSIGWVVRLPVTSNNEMILKSGARLLGASTVGLDFNFRASSALFYDPLALELGTSFQLIRNFKTHLGLDYQYWSRFEPPALIIRDPSIDSCEASGCGINISAGRALPFEFVNVLIPKISEEMSFGRYTLRLGYAYRPSFMKELPTGVGNYLDPPKDIFTAGVGIQFDHFLAFQTACTVDFNFSYQALRGEHVTKTPANENGDLNEPKIGAPGYDTGGSVVGGGVSLTLAF